MAMKLAAGLVEDWYTPVSERVSDDPDSLSDSDEKPTRFKLKPLTQIELLEVMSEGDSLSDGSFQPNHSGRLLLLRRGLVGWDEVYRDGEQVKFSKSEANSLPAQVLGELANEIIIRSVLTDEEKKS